MASWFALLTLLPSRRALLASYLFGVGKYAVGVSWIYVSIHEHGGASPLLAGTMVALFVAFIALFSLLHGSIYLLARGPSNLLNIGVFAAAWVLGEWLQTWLLTGFPWLFAGYALFDTPLVGLAPLGGVLLVGFGAALLAAAAVQALRKRRPGWSMVLASVVVLAGVVSGQLKFTHSGASYEVALVQGNVDQATKWNREQRLPILRRYLALTDPHWSADLIVWPEASLTFYAHQAGDVFAELKRRSQDNDTAVLLGLPAAEQTADGIRFNNTVVAAGNGGGRYLKQRLVPFGEYVPLQSVLRGLIEFFDLPMSRMSSGPGGQPPLRIGDETAVTPICYEIAYPDLVADLVHGGVREATVLVTVSNDTWFGTSNGPLQHLQIARMRALELGRYLLRATNNGVTATVDPRGAVIDQLPQFEQGVLRSSFKAMSGATPFGRTGSVPVVAFSLVLVAAGFYTRRFPKR